MGSDEACEARRQGGPTGVCSGPVPVSVCFHNTTGGVGAPKPTLSFHDSPGLICSGSSRREGQARGSKWERHGLEARPGQAGARGLPSPGVGWTGLNSPQATCDVTCGVASQGTPPPSIGGQVSLGTRLTAHVGGLNLQPLQPQGPENPIVSPDSGLTQRPVNKDALLSGVSQGLRASPRSWAGQSLVGPVGCGQPRAAELTLYCRGGCLQTNGGGGASRWEPGLGGKTCPRVLSSPLAPAATVLPPRLSPGPELPQGPVPRQSPRTGPLSLCTEPPPEPSALEEALVPATG